MTGISNEQYIEKLKEVGVRYKEIKETMVEYRRLKEMQFRHKKELDALCKEYASSGSHVKVGDIISNGAVSIKVDERRWRKGNFVTEFPSSVYGGPVLTKDGRLRNDLSRSLMFQDDLKTINGVKVEAKTND